MYVFKFVFYSVEFETRHNEQHNWAKVGNRFDHLRSTRRQGQSMDVWWASAEHYAVWLIDWVWSDGLGSITNQYTWNLKYSWTNNNYHVGHHGQPHTHIHILFFRKSKSQCVRSVSEKHNNVELWAFNYGREKSNSSTWPLKISEEIGEKEVVGEEGKI